MAGISSVIQLYDNATAPLMNIISSLNLTISAFEDMQDISEREVDTASIDGAWEAAERVASAIVHMHLIWYKPGSIPSVYKEYETLKKEERNRQEEGFRSDLHKGVFRKVVMVTR